MCINGGISIGSNTTTAPTNGLYMKGNMVIDGTDGTNTEMVIKEGGTTKGRIYFDTSMNVMRFTDGANTDTFMLKSGQGYFSGNAYINQSTLITSDKKFKDNVQTIDSALDKTSQLRGVTYTDNRNGQNKIGVIAQEVEAVLPSVVQTEDDTKYVEYNQIIPMLIESIKELKQEVETLKNKCQCK